MQQFSRRWTCLFVVLLVIAFVTPLGAQELRGRITGTVRDNTGGVLPGVPTLSPASWQGRLRSFLTEAAVKLHKSQQPAAAVSPRLASSKPRLPQLNMMPASQALWKNEIAPATPYRVGFSCSRRRCTRGSVAIRRVMKSSSASTLGTSGKNGAYPYQGASPEVTSATSKLP